MVKKQIQKHNIGKNEGPVMKIGKWNYLSLTVFAAATCIFANCTVGSNKQMAWPPLWRPPGAVRGRRPAEEGHADLRAEARGQAEGEVDGIAPAP